MHSGLLWRARKALPYCKELDADMLPGLHGVLTDLKVSHRC